MCAIGHDQTSWESIICVSIMFQMGTYASLDDVFGSEPSVHLVSALIYQARNGPCEICKEWRKR